MWRRKTAKWRKLQEDENMKSGRAVYGDASIVLEEKEWKLYLGGVFNANDAEGLARLGITRILNVAEEAPMDATALIASICVLGPRLGTPKVRKIKEKQYRKQVIDDMLAEGESQLEDFDKCYAFIEKAREAGENVLVHCMRGRSRSTSVVLYYLMKRLGMSLLDAHVSVKQARPIIGPHYYLKVQMMHIEKDLLQVKESSVADAWIRGHGALVPIDEH